MTSDPPAPRVRVIGRGRAGGALATALGRVGWPVETVPGRGPHLHAAAADVDLVVVAVPDGAVAATAAAIAPSADVVVAHLAGSMGLDVLEPHRRRASLHPLVALPDPLIGADRLVGAVVAVAGDPLVDRIVEVLGARPIDVPDEVRTAYHAAAVIASNHLVGLLGQVARVGASAGVPLDAYLDLVRATVDNVERLGPAAALTGPVARGDEATIRRHLDALDPSEVAAYEAMVEQCRRLVEPGLVE